MKARELVSIIEKVVPPEWALPDDPIGFLVGDPEQDVQRVLVGLEASAALLKKAQQKKADFLLVHHPLIYRPLKRVLENDPVQRLVRELIHNDMALYAAHTNADFHPEGMAKIWATKLGCTRISCTSAKPAASMLKIVTFVPQEHAGSIRAALSQAGAGAIGEYEQCSYNLKGWGTFQGSEASNPFIGEAGKFETVDEVRLEMVLPTKRKSSVIRALWQSHPYEEPAFDLYRLEDTRSLQNALWVAEFDKGLSWNEFETRVQKSLPKGAVLTGVKPDIKRKIKKIALSTGSGRDFIPVAMNMSVDAYLTGEAGYHDLWAAQEQGLNVLVAGHDASESFFAEMMIPLLENKAKGVKFVAE